MRPHGDVRRITLPPNWRHGAVAHVSLPVMRPHGDMALVSLSTMRRKGDVGRNSQPCDAVPWFLQAASLNQ